jgi:hypothetical protein
MMAAGPRRRREAAAPDAAASRHAPCSGISPLSASTPASASQSVRVTLQPEPTRPRRSGRVETAWRQVIADCGVTAAIIGFQYSASAANRGRMNECLSGSRSGTASLSLRPNRFDAGLASLTFDGTRVDAAIAKGSSGREPMAAAVAPEAERMQMQTRKEQQAWKEQQRVAAWDIRPTRHEPPPSPAGRRHAACRHRVCC